MIDKELFALHNEGFMGTDIAEKLGVSLWTVYSHAKNLGLKWHPELRSIKVARILSEKARARREKRFKEICDFLRKNGATQKSKLDKLFGSQTSVSGILREHSEVFQLLHVRWSANLSGTRGGVMKASRFIKPQFHSTRFVTLKNDRTSIIRFFMGIFLEQDYSQYDAKVINQWLQRFELSRAERVAVITHLGYKYKTLQHIMINGWLNNKPT